MRFKPNPFLLPLSLPYQAAVQLRNRAYDNKIITTHDVEVPVVSVGNISIGGTGKTPFVLTLLDLLHQLKLPRKGRSAVVSRGYKGKAKTTTTVSDGKHIFVDAETAGDEPVMIAQGAAGSIVVVDKNRTRGANHAIKDLKAGAIILDDGFQHRKLNRNLDIVLLDGKNPLGSKRLLPAGILREPASSLQRADIIILSNPSGNLEELSKRAEMLESLIGRPVIVTRHEPQYWKRAGRNELMGLEEVQGRNVLGFCGIANPKVFFESVAAEGANIVGKISLPDHGKYKKNVVNNISKEFSRLKAEWLVTTAKDGVKLPPLFCLLPIYQLFIKTKILIGQERLEKALVEIFLVNEK